MNFYSAIEEVGILPVICLKNEEELETFERAIVKTPVKCFEITMRHPFSYKAIEYFKKTRPQLIVGAGTVVNGEILRDVAQLGADFCVSPGFDKNIVEQAAALGMPFIPGCATPTEILGAQCMGLDAVKLFPAECFGGVGALKLYASAFRGVRFLPTGGITLDNYLSYLSCENVLGCGGSFMIPKDLMQNRDSEGIAQIVNSSIKAAWEVKK